MQDDAQPNLNFWKSAVQMQRAALTFAPKRLVMRWRELQQVSVLKALKTSMAETDGKDLKFDKVLTAITAKPGEIMMQRIQSLKACEAEVLHLIKSKSLLCFAFEKPRTVRADALQLSSSVWQGKLNWNEGTIVHEGLTFIEVRLIAATKHQSLLGAALDQVVSAAEPARMGRPGMAVDIAEAFFALREGGKYDLNISVRTQCDMIREWLIHWKPDGEYNPGRPGYETIRRHINPLIKAEKSSTKLFQH